MVDDLVLLPADPSGVVQRRTVKGRTVVAPDAGIGSLAVDDGMKTALDAVGALPKEGSDEVAEELAEVLPLPLSDVFSRVTLEVTASGARLLCEGEGRLVLRIDNEMLEGGSYRIRSVAEAGADAAQPLGSFEAYSGDGKFERVTGILWGGQLNRVLVSPRAPVSLRVDSSIGALRCTLSMPGHVDLQLLHEEEIRQALRLARQAEDAYNAHDAGKALVLYGQILHTTPFDTDSVERARQRRGELLATAGATLEHLRGQFEEAKVFPYEGIFRDLLRELAKLESMQSELGSQLSDLHDRVLARLAEIEKGRNESRGAHLLDMAKSLYEAKQERLSGLIARYITERLSGTEAAKQAAELKGK